MTEVARNKGQFVQAGMVCLFPAPSGSVVSHDGTLGMDEVVLQADFPYLFQVIGVQYNLSDKGDDDATQFRTPPTDNLPSVPGFEYRIRF